MQNFTEKRVKNTSDEVWLLEHESIYTYGVKTNINDIPNNISLPILKSDRGGEITFHGPGQLIDEKKIDCVINLAAKAGVRKSVLHPYEYYQTNLLINNDEPGIYFDNKKIVSFGLKITQKGTYHGASINISMDLAPWKEIAICGNSQIEAIDLETLGCKIPLSEIRDSINKKLAEKFE